MRSLRGVGSTLPFQEVPGRGYRGGLRPPYLRSPGWRQAAKREEKGAEPPRRTLRLPRESMFRAPRSTGLAWKTPEGEWRSRVGGGEGPELVWGRGGARAAVGERPKTVWGRGGARARGEEGRGPSAGRERGGAQARGGRGWSRARGGEGRGPSAADPFPPPLGGLGSGLSARSVGAATKPRPASPWADRSPGRGASGGGLGLSSASDPAGVLGPRSALPGEKTRRAGCAQRGVRKRGAAPPGGGVSVKEPPRSSL